MANVNARVFFREIYNLLADSGFAIFRVTPAGRLIPVSAYTEDYECFARTTTYSPGSSPESLTLD